MSLGKSIKLFRKKAKLNQKELADLTGLSLTAICDYENDRYFPSKNNLINIAESLNTTVNLILLCSVNKDDLSPEKRETFTILLDAMIKLV